MAMNAKQKERRLTTSSDESRNTLTPGGAAGAHHNKSARVSFSATPVSVFDTYSSMEYERKDAETNPLTASVVFQLEKLIDSLDGFNVTLNKGTSGLGFSIVGMGFGDNLGPADKLSICVKQILDQGTAQKDGRIHPGDQIIEVNGKSMVGVTYQEAVDILKSATGKVSLRMGRRKPGDATPEGLLHQQLVQMGASSPVPSTAIGHHSGQINDDHRLTRELAKIEALTTHAPLQGPSTTIGHQGGLTTHQGPSTTIGHQSGHINDGMTRQATLNVNAALQGPSTTIGHHNGQINGDHRLTGEVVKKAAPLPPHSTLHGSNTTIGHPIAHGQINNDHKQTDGMTKQATLTTQSSLHGPSTAIGHHSGQLNDDHRITDDLTKRASLTANAYTRRDSSSDEEQARKRLSSDYHGIDDLQPNPKALMLKLELASIKRRELERQLEVIRTEINGVLRQRSTDGKSSRGDSVLSKLIEVETTLSKARHETDRMKALRDDSERQIDELDKRLRSEIRLMHETHSTSLKVIEQFRSKEQEHDNEKESIKRRLCDMDQQYEKQIHTLTEKIRHLEVRFSGSYDEIDMVHTRPHVTPGIALAVNHANDPRKVNKTGSHSSDSDSEDGRRRKLITTHPVTSSGPAHAHYLKTDSVVSIHSPAKKSTETSSSITTIVKTTRHSDSDMDVVFGDAPPDYAPPPVPDGDSSDSDKARPRVSRVDLNDSLDGGHRLEIGVAMGTAVAGQRLLEKRLSNDDGEHSKIGVQLEYDKHLKKDQVLGQGERLRERDSSDDEGNRKALKMPERQNVKVENFDILKRSNSSEKLQKTGHDSNSSDEESSKRKLGFGMGQGGLPSGTGHSSGTGQVAEVGVHLGGRRMSVEGRHSGRSSETGESPALGRKLRSGHSPERSKMSDDNSDKEGKSHKDDKKAGNEKSHKKFGLFGSKKKRTESGGNEDDTDDDSDEGHTKTGEETKAKKGKTKWGRKRKDEDRHKDEHDSDEDMAKRRGSKDDKKKAKEEAKQKKEEKKKAKEEAKLKKKGKKENDGITMPVMGVAAALENSGDISSEDEIDHSTSKKNKKTSSKNSSGIIYPVMGGAVALKNQGEISSDEDNGHGSKKNKKVLSKDSGGITYPVMGGAIALKKEGEISSDEDNSHGSKKNKKVLSKDSGGITYPVMGGAIALKSQGEISSDEDNGHGSKKNKKVLSKDSGGITYPVMGGAIALKNQGEISSDEDINNPASKKNKKVLSKDSGGITYPVMGGAIALKKEGEISSDEDNSHGSKKNKKVLSKDSGGITYPVMGGAIALRKEGEISSDEDTNNPASKKNKKVLSKDSGGITYPVMGGAVALKNHGAISSEDEFSHSTLKKNQKVLSTDPQGISYPAMGLAVALENRGEISSDEDNSHSASKKNKAVSSKDNDGITFPAMGIAVAVGKQGETSTTASASTSKPDVKIASRFNKHRDSDGVSLGSRGSSRSSGDEGHDHSGLKSSHKAVHKTIEASFRPWKSTPDVSGNRDLMMSFSSYPSSSGQVEYNGRLADQWSTEEVATWLIAINLGELVGVFERHDVDGGKLLALSTNSFKEMEISGKNKDLLKKKIKELQSAIAKDKKLREKEEKQREKEEKAQAKLRKKEASKKMSSKKHRGPDEGSVGSRASSDDEDHDHSRSTSSHGHVGGHSTVGASSRPWKSTSDVSANSGLMMSFSSYPSSSGQMESAGRLADQWSTEEVASWLISISLAELVGVFERHGVDGMKLLDLSTNSFKEMEISGKNKDLLKKKIKELQTAIAKEKKFREKEEKQREKDEKAQEKLRKKEAAKNK